MLASVEVGCRSAGQGSLLVLPVTLISPGFVAATDRERLWPAVDTTTYIGGPSLRLARFVNYILEARTCAIRPAPCSDESG